MSPDAHFPAAKLLQKFGINKDLTVKIKFILIFSGKYWVFAQGCERKFGGNPPGVYVVKEGKGRAEVTTNFSNLQDFSHFFLGFYFSSLIISSGLSMMRTTPASANVSRGTNPHEHATNGTCAF